MILLNHVIQVFVGPDERLSGQDALGLQFGDGLMGRLTAVERDLPLKSSGFSEGSWVMPRIIHNDQICTRTVPRGLGGSNPAWLLGDNRRSVRRS